MDLVHLRQLHRLGLQAEEGPGNGDGRDLGRGDVLGEHIGRDAVDAGRPRVREGHRPVQGGVEDLVGLFPGADREHGPGQSGLPDRLVAVDVRPTAVDEFGGAPVEREAAGHGADRQGVGEVPDAGGLVPHGGRGGSGRGVPLDRVGGPDTDPGLLGQLDLAEVRHPGPGQGRGGVLVQRELDDLAADIGRQEDRRGDEDNPEPGEREASGPSHGQN